MYVFKVTKTAWAHLTDFDEDDAWERIFDGVYDFLLEEPDYDFENAELVEVDDDEH